MTDAAYAPSAQPRPGADRRGTPPNLRLVTVGKAEGCIAADETPTVAPDSRGSRQARLQAVITDSAQWAAWVKSGLAYFTPPKVWVEQPASLAELADYARHAQWTRSPYVAAPYTDETTKEQVKTGAIRAAGIWWYRIVGLPKTVCNRYSEWVWQRPGRAIPVLLLIKLIASTSYGSWAVDHLFTPAVQAVAWVLL